MNEAVLKAFGEIASSDRLFDTEGEGPMRILVMSGLPFSGKSTIAKGVRDKLGGNVLIVRSDSIRPHVARYMGREAPEYDQEEHVNTFALGRLLLQLALKKGHPAIADATNLRNEYRAWAVGAAQEMNAEALVVHVKVDVFVALERMKKGAAHDSAATARVYQMLKKEYEPIEESTTPYYIIDTKNPVEPEIDILAKWMGGKIDKIPRMVDPGKKVDYSTNDILAGIEKAYREGRISEDTYRRNMEKFGIG